MVDNARVVKTDVTAANGDAQRGAHGGHVQLKGVWR
jgi:hypothetical protein